MKHFDLEISSNKLLNIVPEVFDAKDEPFADSSALPFFALSKEVSKNVTVALSGDGGDEIFGGYRKYIGEKWSYLGRNIPLFMRIFFGRNSGINSILDNISLIIFLKTLCSIPEDFNSRFKG